MRLKQHIQHELIWATHRRVPDLFRQSYLSSSVHYMAWYIIEGSVSVEYHDGENLHINAGQWLFHRCIDGMQTFSKNAELVSVRFDLVHANGIPLFERAKNVIVPANQSATLLDYAKSLVTRLNPHRKANSNFVIREDISTVENYQIEAALCAWIAEYIRLMLANGQLMTNGQFADTRLQKAVHLLNQHPTVEKLSETEIANQCGLSVNRLNALFKENLKSTIGEFYAARRLRLARQALLNTNKPMKEIAYELGYSSPSHFTNWFSVRQKISPRAYRTQISQRDR